MFSCTEDVPNYFQGRCWLYRLNLNDFCKYYSLKSHFQAKFVLSTVCIAYIVSYGLLEINFMFRNWKKSNVNFKFMPHLHNFVQPAESMTWFWDINNPPAELQGHEIYGRCVWLSCISTRSLLELVMLSWFRIRLVFLWLIHICFLFISIILKGSKYCHGMVKTVPLILVFFLLISHRMWALIAVRFCSFL